MTLTNLGSLVGTITGILALFFHVLQWLKQGPRLRAAARSGYKAFAKTGGFLGSPQAPGVAIPLTMITVQNVGDRGTTILKVAVQYFKTRWQRWRKRPETTLLLMQPTLYTDAPPLPYHLEPGKQWLGGFDERWERIAEMLQDGYLYVQVISVDAIKSVRVDRNGLAGDGRVGEPGSGKTEDHLEY